MTSISPALPPRSQRPEAAAASLSGPARRRAEALTSLFENGTITLQYGYAERLDDGRGVTAGRAGFTTGTDDALAVIERYTAQAPKNPLAKYLPKLRALAALADDDPKRGSTSGLQGYEAAWRQAAKDPAFRAAQDAEVEATYFGPSQRLADGLALRTPLARAQLYDAIIQHGDGDDPDGLPALIARANTAAGGSPATGVDEQAWLRRFLAERRRTLAHAHDPATRREWAQSVDRVGVFEDLVAAGAWALDRPLEIKHGDFAAAIP